MEIKNLKSGPCPIYVSRILFLAHGYLYNFIYLCPRCRIFANILFKKKYQDAQVEEVLPMILAWTSIKYRLNERNFNDRREREDCKNNPNNYKASTADLKYWESFANWVA